MKALSASLFAMIFTVMMALSASVNAGTCAGPAFGPGGCPDTLPIQPTGPAELCLPDGCTRVNYSFFGDFALAEGTLMNGYRILGWAGPCNSPDHTKCPNIYVQAFEDMRINGLRANRAQRY